ncbi:carbohydrate-binding module family 18 protein [Piromyces sp. E2]|nr:carbohydrate-binding module family 18 protein [Piromyces sp. E2]|eukprot:OUM59688.1 carbohydrate-binding module family 18 protein [Piromyces sp. E2]
MKNINFLFLVLNSILLFNTTFAKSVNNTLSSSDKKITKSRREDQKYLLLVNNTFGEFNIFSNPYNQKHVKRQELDSFDFAVSIMDEIDELINENRNTFKDPEKLEEIEHQANLRKRDNENNLSDAYDNSSFVFPVSSHGHSLLISAYLSEKLVKKNAVVPDVEMEANDATYYNKNDILKESSWRDLTVQNNADLHLSIISQGLYKNNLVGQYDKNYYYPSSGGKGIDIIVIDGGFNFDFFEYKNSERTAKCRVAFDSTGTPKSTNSKSCGKVSKHHGINVATMAAGLNHGIAKHANIYGVAIPMNENDKFDTSVIIKAFEYILKNMIRPNKTVIAMSIGSFWEKKESYYDTLFKQYQSVMKRITNEGGIVLVSAGNNGENVDQSSKAYVPCIVDNLICVGGIQSDKISSVTNSYVKSEKSNFGNSVDIYAPYNVYTEYTNNGEIVSKRVKGTSFSTPLTAGVVATIMGDNPNTKYTTNSILKYLLNDGVSFKVDGKVKKVVNNGKHIVYSSDGKYKGCGIEAGNKKCSSSSSDTIPTSPVTDRCGPEYGKCADKNACCSQYGYCDTTSAHCGTGCQPKYGLCSNSNSKSNSNSIPVSSVEDRCGPEFGKCADKNACCSQYGYCDTTSAHCGTGCQPLYGICK